MENKSDLNKLFPLKKVSFHELLDVQLQTVRYSNEMQNLLDIQYNAMLCCAMLSRSLQDPPQDEFSELSDGFTSPDTSQRNLTDTQASVPEIVVTSSTTATTSTQRNSPFNKLEAAFSVTPTFTTPQFPRPPRSQADRESEPDTGSQVIRN